MFSIERYEIAVEEIKNLLNSSMGSTVHIDNVWEILDTWLDTSEEEENV
jgi:hypothetical protein